MPSYLKAFKSLIIAVIAIEKVDTVLVFYISNFSPFNLTINIKSKIKPSVRF